MDLAKPSPSDEDHPPAMDEFPSSSRAEYLRDFVNKLPVDDQKLLQNIMKDFVVDDQVLMCMTLPEHKPTLDPMVLLPMELITQIFEYDGLIAAMRPRQVSKLWRKILNDPLILGKHLQSWSSDSDPPLICERKSLNHSTSSPIVHQKKLEAMHRFRNGKPSRIVEIRLESRIVGRWRHYRLVALSQDHLAYLDTEAGLVLVNLATGRSQAFFVGIDLDRISDIVLTPSSCWLIHDDTAPYGATTKSVARVIDLETKNHFDVTVSGTTWMQGWHCAGDYMAFAWGDTSISRQPIPQIVQVFHAKSQHSQRFQIRLPDIERAEVHDPDHLLSFTLCSIVVDERSMMVTLAIVIRHSDTWKYRFDIRRFSFKDEFEVSPENRLPLIGKTLLGAYDLLEADESVLAKARLPPFKLDHDRSLRDWQALQSTGEEQRFMLNLDEVRICLDIDTMSYAIDTSVKGVWHRFNTHCRPLDYKNIIYSMEWTRDHTVTIRPDFVATTRHDAILRDSGPQSAKTQADLDRATIDQIHQIGIPKWGNECDWCGHLDCGPKCRRKTVILGNSRFVTVLGRQRLYILAFDPDWDLTEEHFAGLSAPEGD